MRITTVSESLELLLGNQIDFIKKHYDVVMISQNNDNGLVRLGEEKNLPVYPVNLTRKITPFQDLLALFRLIKIIKKEKPEIIHTHTPKAGLIGMLAARISGTKHRLHTVAGMPLLETSGLKYYLLTWLERLNYKCATRVYFNSKGLMNIVLDRKISNNIKKFRVIAKGSTSGVDADHFNPNDFSENDLIKIRDQHNIKKSDTVLLFVGRIVKDKGVNELISAFKLLSSERNDVKLLLLGKFENDLNPISKEAFSEIKENKNILCLGHKKDVRPYFAISNFFVFPSYREGFPNVVLQAGAMGIPSIVSNINGSNEIIIDNLNGKIVPVKDTKALYLAMKDWYENPNDLSRMRNKSRQIIIESYSQKVVFHELLKEYNTFH